VTGGTVAPPGTPPGGTPSADQCPDDGDTSFKLQFFNDLNETGAENYDETCVCEDEDGARFTITDTTSPSPSATLNCGKDVTCKCVSVDGAAGDHSKILSIRSGAGGNTDAKIVNGNLKFHAGSSNVNIDVGSSQHGVLETRVWDATSAGWMYGQTETTKGTWITTAKRFTGTSGNMTDSGTIAIGSGGKLDIEMGVRVNSAQDQQFEDEAFYLLIDAASNKYDTPDVEIDGVTYASDCTILNEDETLAYSGEEYCYYVDGVEITNNKDIVLGLVFNALSGVDPGAADDINVSFANIGGYQSTTDTTNIKVGSVKDDSSQTAVYTIQEWMLDVS